MMRVIARVLATVGATISVLMVFATPSLAHFGYITGSTFGSSGTGAGQFKTPVGVAIDEGTGDVYVVDQGSNRVERFEANGKYLSEVNGSETPATAFASPTYVTVDNSRDAAKGHVYVADPSQGVIDAFDSSGKYLFQIATSGIEAITTDTSGHLWVWTNQTSFEEYSETGGTILRQPVGRETTPGIAVDSSGNVYVLYGSEKVGRFSPPTFIEDNEAGEGGSAVALAINPVTNNIFQDDGSSIVEWPPFGEGPELWQKTEEAFSGTLTNSHGLAVNGKTGALYASDESTNDVELFTTVVTPDATTGPASALTTNSASIEGSIDPDKTKTSYFFEWGESASYGDSTAVEEAGEGEAAIPVSAHLTGLGPNTIYHYRVVASNENGVSTGADETLTTLSLPPVVEGAPNASHENRSSVVLQTQINPRHSTTNYHFVYVEEAAYAPAAIDPYAAGGETSATDIGAGSGGQAVEQLLGGLKPATKYHYEVIAINRAGRVTGTDGMFTTGALTPPITTTGGSSGIAQNSAIVSGALSTRGLPTTYGFEIGTSTDYGPATGLGAVGAGAGEAEVSLALTGLVSGTTYHFRLTATNVDGTSYGADQTFMTGVFANTFATPPAPLPFVAVPPLAFPSEPKPVIVKKRAKARGKKAKKHDKTMGKKKPKNKKKK
jgi:hypothetical protein